MNFLDTRLAAVRAMSRFPSARSVAMMRQILDDGRNPPQLRVAAAGGLARMGQMDQDGLKLAVVEAACQPEPMLRDAYKGEKEVTPAEVNQLQQLAAVSLGYMNRPASIDALATLLHDDDVDVQVAAAMGILRLVEAPAPAPAAAEPQAVTPAATTAPAGVQPATAPCPTTAPAVVPAASRPRRRKPTCRWW